MKKYIIIMALALLAIGCKAPKTISTTTHDTVYINKTEVEWRTKFDSIYIDRFVDRYVKGDTVFRTETVINDRWHILHDTLRTTDTLHTTDTQVVEKEKIVRKYPLLWLDIIVVLLIAGGVIYYLGSRK